MTNQTKRKQGDIAAVRDEYPSGLRVFMQNESVGYMIDALMDMPGTQFSKSLLAEKAGVSRQSVHTHMTLLVNLGIVNEVVESEPVEYTLNDDDEIIRLLHHLEAVINRRLNPKADEHDGGVGSCCPDRLEARSEPHLGTTHPRRRPDRDCGKRRRQRRYEGLFK